ncbi:hypothetical protein TSUD_255950 [Trifolium subterraneum]|uniref:Cystatin domain-containing protein n=1 Tax=Trifolium subterraneum TaxID=3900 RepID=A0A2Z6NR82_TRISU|nr:hypothetical protein TSUD_255950 [Trifolium subterraneum]
MLEWVGDDTSFVLHEVKEHQKENFIFYHSLKLAATYGLLATKPGKAIRIVKNILLCGDCHSFLKYVSIVVILRNLRGVPSGGWNLIQDINDPFVTDIANFVVSEFNKQTGATLKFEKVIKGESQLVTGENYHLIVSTSNSVHSIYDVVVYDRPWDHFRNLTSFIPVINDDSVFYTL